VITGAETIVAVHPTKGVSFESTLTQAKFGAETCSIGVWTSRKGRSITMTLNPILITVWAVLAVVFFGLLIYRGQLTRYEDEQLFLGESASKHSMDEHNQLISRVQRLEPIMRIVGAAASLATAFAVGMYVWDAYQRIQ